MASPMAGDAPLAAPAPAADSPFAAPAADALFAAPAPAADALFAAPAPAADASFAAPAADALFAAPAPAAVPDADAEFGSQRHVFLWYKGPDLCSSRLEAAESNCLPTLLAAAIKARKHNLKKTIKFAICEGEDGTESSNGDVLIFPDMKRYKGLTHFDVDEFVEEVLVKNCDWLPASSESIGGCYVFVFSDFSHGSRDKGCDLIKRFKKEINGLGLYSQVSVSACSPVGGHKDAGNVIIFSRHANGEVTGWYGYVLPDDVPVLLHKHIGQEVVDYLWRGQMGLSKEQQKQALKLQSMMNGDKESLEETGTEGACNPSAAGGCCQGNGGFTCCQTDLPKEKQDKTIAAEQNPKSCPALRMKRSKLLPSPARDMKRRLTPMPHRANPHQGRKGSPCLSSSDWSPALREKENELSRSSLSAVKQDMPKWAEKDIAGNRMRPFSHKERERAPLMENYLPANQPESSLPAWGQGMPGKGMRPLVDRSIYRKERGLSRPWGEQEVAQVRNSGCHTDIAGNRMRPFSHKERERAPLMENYLPANQPESSLPAWGQGMPGKGMRPLVDRSIYRKERGLSRPWGEREVAQVRNSGCHTPWPYGSNPECEDAKGRPHGEWGIYRNERVLSRSQVEREAAQVRNGGCRTLPYRGSNPECKDAKDWRKELSGARLRTQYWWERKPAGGSQKSFSHGQSDTVCRRGNKGPRPERHMLYSSKMVYSSHWPSSWMNNDDHTFEMTSPHYCPYSD